MPKSNESAAASDDQARGAEQMPEVNANPKGVDELERLADRAADAIFVLEERLQNLSLEEVRLRHEEDLAAKKEDEWAVPWNSISHTLLWLAVLLLIAKEFMT